MPASTYMGLAPALYNEPITKAASFTLAREEVGAVIIVTAVATCTLPDPTADWKGASVTILNQADAILTVKTATADTLITVNDAAADSVATSTASHKIGASIWCYCDGTNWWALGQTVGGTITVST